MRVSNQDRLCKKYGHLIPAGKPWCPMCHKLWMRAHYKTRPGAKTKEECLRLKKAGYEAYRAAWVFDPCRPCKYGHVCPTRKKGRQCPECHRITQLGRYNRKYKAIKPGTSDILSRLPLSREEAAARRVVGQRIANKIAFQRYKIRNRPAAAIAVARRRAKKNGNGGQHTLADREFVWKLQRGKCAYAKFALPWCSKKIEKNSGLSGAHWDHIVPICRGGSDDASNGQWLCAACNRRKWDRTDSEFLFKCKVQDLFVATAVAQGGL